MTMRDLVIITTTILTWIKNPIRKITTKMMESRNLHCLLQKNHTKGLRKHRHLKIHGPMITPMPMTILKYLKLVFKLKKTIKIHIKPNLQILTLLIRKRIERPLVSNVQYFLLYSV